MTVAKIAISAATFAIDRPYSYRVPPALAGVLQPGMRVLVPFGTGNRTSEGLVLSVEEAEGGKLKEIVTLLDETPVLSPQGIQLALWMRERFFCTVYAAALTMLPTGLWYVLKESYALAPGIDRETWETQTEGRPRAHRILTLLQANGGRAALEQIQALEDLKEKIGIKKTIKDYGVDEKYFLDTLDEMVENAFNDQCTGANPRYPLMSEIKEIYLKCYYGK